MSPPWKYPAEALGRVLPGSQDVNVNFLPVTEETLFLSLSVSPSPTVTVLLLKEAFLFPALQSDTEEHLRSRLLCGLRDPTSGGCIDFQ